MSDTHHPSPIIKNGNRGFTLVELMVALVMATITVLGTMTLAEMSTRSYRAQERVTDAQQGVRGAMDMMVRDIRRAGYDPLSQTQGRTAGVGFLTAANTNLRFGADLDATGVIDALNEDVTYNLVGDQLMVQRFGEAAQVFIDNVNALAFTYLDDTDTVTTNLFEIAQVVVNLTVRAVDADGTVYDRALTTRINCRNLRM